MRKYFLILTLTMLAFTQTSTAFAATEITGTITEKRGDTVKVEFQPHETAAPAVGDKVEFSTLLQGLKVGAGTGVVTEVDGEAVWVKTNDDRPRPKMTAVIQSDNPQKRNTIVNKEEKGPGTKTKESVADAKDLFNKGRELYEKQKYKEAADYFRKAADQGHLNAQSHLGYLYDEGKGVAQDYAEVEKIKNEHISGGTPPQSSHHDISGTWNLNANSWTGKLEFYESNGNLKGQVWFDAYKKWEKLTKIKFDGVELRFLRPGSNQPHVGTVKNNKIHGTFTYQGGTYDWEASR